jgi:hypothetical protein
MTTTQRPERAVKPGFDALVWANALAAIYGKMRAEGRQHLTYDEWLGKRGSYARAALDAGLVTLEELAAIAADPDAVIAKHDHPRAPSAVGAQLRRCVLIALARKVRAKRAAIPAHVESEAWNESLERERRAREDEAEREQQMRLLREDEIARDKGRGGKVARGTTSLREKTASVEI